MPYGTVNLLHGVPEGETPVTCTAGVGTFIVEFGALTRLTGDPVFEDTALRAMKALWQSRSSIGLVNFLYKRNVTPKIPKTKTGRMKIVEIVPAGIQN